MATNRRPASTTIANRHSKAIALRNLPVIAGVQLTANACVVRAVEKRFDGLAGMPLPMLTLRVQAWKLDTG